MKRAGKPRKKADVARLQARRAALRAQLRRRRGTLESKGAPRRRRRWLLVLLLLLLVLAILCCLRPEDPPPEVEAPGEVIPAAGGPAVPVVVAAPLTGRVERQERPAFRTESPEPLPWLAAFRMQVSVRSPRLSGCFDGVARPGTLKWTAAVEPQSGRVSEATVEPTLQSDPLSAVQRACVLAVLSEPPYRLEAGPEARATPSRVSLAIEF